MSAGGGSWGGNEKAAWAPLPYRLPRLTHGGGVRGGGKMDAVSTRGAEIPDNIIWLRGLRRGEPPESGCRGWEKWAEGSGGVG